MSLLIIGNKSDLDKDRIITKARAMEFASQHNVEYIETSALLNINVTESVKLLLDAVMDRLEQNLSKPKQDSIRILHEQIAKELSNNTVPKPKPKPSSQSLCCSN